MINLYSISITAMGREGGVEEILPILGLFNSNLKYELKLHLNPNILPNCAAAP